jgi:predicted dehydrogenase
MPMAYTKSYGNGRVAYLANGHDLRAWRHPEFQKLLVRAIAWSAGAETPEGKIRCGLLGYGPAFNMGKGHAGWINAIAGMQAVAMCDVVRERVEAARQELPELKGYFTSLEEMLAMDYLDLVVNILPHNLHAPATVQCLQAGKHVIVEKPFCLNVEEADRMIETARAKGRLLSVFHNRRWDHDYLAIRDILQKGLIGEVFHIEAFIGDYAHPGFWWRSDKRISGGVMHDWGAHFVDWILNLVPSPIQQVTGDFQKRVWNSVTIEDHGQAYIRFENGVTADFMISSIAASKRPKWRILGTQGSLEANWNDELNLTTFVSGFRQESKVMVPKQPPSWSEYYRNIADHLLMGEELAVKPEQARRVIATIQAAQESSMAGVSVAPLVK